MTLLVPELIRKKRDGGKLTSEELSFLVRGFADGSIPDYQITAWLMSVFFRGMEPDETVMLTRFMKDSGESFDWATLDPGLKGARFADKHSTGGVGDKVSLILAPMAVCLGLTVPMMSGRGLAFTGGTVDKLQSIDGFNMFPTKIQMVRCLNEVGTCMMAQSPTLCPADRKLYSLRDVTATVESLPLIVASILSKKWAAGVKAIVFDVKCGRGAFMQTFEEAERLARALVDVSKLAGMAAHGAITRMDEPLGAFIGNALEVRESVAILRQDFSTPERKRLAAPLTKLCAELAALMAKTAGLPASAADAEATLHDGRAWSVFEDMVKEQGGRPGWEERLASSKSHVVVTATQAGQVAACDSRTLGLLGVRMGVGREAAESKLDPGAGFELHARPGDQIAKGQPLATLWASTISDELVDECRRAFKISDEPAPPAELLIGGID